VFLSILFSSVQQNIAEAFRAAVGTPGFQAALADPAVLADPANRAVISALGGSGATPAGTGVLEDSSFLTVIDARLARPFLEGFAQSMSVVFLVGAAVLVLGLIAVILMREVPLRRLSGIEAQRAAAAAAEPAVVAPPSVPATAVTADVDHRASHNGDGSAPRNGDPRTARNGASRPTV
jgi:hypothetical protein